MKTTSQRILLLALVLIYTSVSFSQKSKISKAEKDYDKYSYIDAREIYLKVIEDGYSSAQVLEKLGDTYYYNGQYNEASKWYSKLIAEYPSEVNADYYYKAAQSLKSLEKYDESNALMEIYAEKGGNPMVVKLFKENPNYLEKIRANALDLKIRKANINSDGSDFVSSFNNGNLVFSSTNNSTGDKTYEWTQEGYLDLYEADIDDKGNLSNPRTIKGEVNSPYHESSTTVSKDGSTMYFTRNNFINGKKDRGKDKTIGLKIYKVTKGSEDRWEDIIELPFNNDNYSVAYPTLSPDGKRLYFSSDMPGTLGMSDLWYVDVLGDSQYSEPVNLGSTINTEAKEAFPFISSDNKLYFSSDGRMGLGGLDVFVTQIGDNGEIGTISNLGSPTNSPSDDFAFIYNLEKEFGYVSSNRDGLEGSVSDDIYILNKCEVTIEGTVTNKETLEIIEGATVVLLDENNKTLESVVSGADGRYRFKKNVDCGTIYLVRASSTGCEFLEKVIETPKESQVYELPMPLYCDPCPPNDLGCRLSLQPIYFDFDRFNIRPDAEIELAKILAAMRQYPELIIHIESHTDSRAPNKYNELLSEKRAQSTLNWLVDQGIDRARLSAKGYGENQLVNQCADGVKCTEEEHQLNRRSMFLIQN
ncbi:MAG: OmpA family protein [Flavobacteriaceae bacterium]|nr:OmpA family protein [Flavobacteriaceae bacterium]